MSKHNIQEKIEDICENFKRVDHNEHARLLEQITTEIATYIRQENNDNNSMDGVFDFLSNLVESV